MALPIAGQSEQARKNLLCHCSVLVLHILIELKCDALNIYCS